MYQPVGYVRDERSTTISSVASEASSTAVSGLDIGKTTQDDKRGKTDQIGHTARASKLSGEKMAKKIVAGKLAMEDGVEYHISLIKALFLTVRQRCLKAAMYNIIRCKHLSATILPLCSCHTAGLAITVPLVTRIIIEQLTIAYTLHAAMQSGLPTVGLEQPKSVGYGIGIAIGLFVMLTGSSAAGRQSQQRAAVAGFMLRSAVSLCLIRQHLVKN
jgi:hypothetical protein